MEVSMINLLDTLTNLVFLMVAILPAYIIGLSLVIGDMPRLSIPTLHPMIKVKVNGHLKIITLRNPITNKWITTITVPMPAQHVTLTPSKPIAAFGNPYRYAMGCIAIAFLVACNPAQVDDTGYSDNTVGWYSDYQVPDLVSGKVFFAGMDTILKVNGPIVTYYSDKPIKDALVSVVNNNGYRASIASYYENEGSIITVYMDEIKAIPGAKEIRFDVMAYSKGYVRPFPVMNPKGVCIESYPVIPDTLVKGLENWDLKVSDRTNARCGMYRDTEFISCASRDNGDLQDTVFIIDTYCPATLKARAELGGN